MNTMYVVSGIILFLVFAGLSSGALNFLGNYIWIVALVIFVVLMMAMGKIGMPKAPEDIKNAWTFGIVFTIVVTVMMTFVSPYFGGTSMSADQVGNYMIAFWLVVFGGVMFIGGWNMKMTNGAILGVIWLFSSIYYIYGTGTAAAGLMWFGILTGVPFIIMGAMMKK